MKAAALRKLHRAVDRHLAERVSVQPMQSGRYLGGAASGDPAATVAYISEASRLLRTSDTVTGHNVELIGVARAAKIVTSSLPFEVAPGFVLTRLDAPEQPQYRVFGVYPFGTDRTILTLIEV